MTREEAVGKWIYPAIATMWNTKKCNEILEALEPKTGHWIEEDMFDGDIAYRCSECDEAFCLIDGTPTDNMYNYCPNCGIKMEGKNE